MRQMILLFGLGFLPFSPLSAHDGQRLTSAPPD